MLKLLDTGWVAYRFGKWRWVPYFAAGLVFMVIGWAATEILAVVQSMNPAGADAGVSPWPFALTAALALLLMIYSVWLCYVDGVREDYKKSAEHYRTHGW
ncbi:MAG: hypothetical protein JSR41_07635 [Proteobacteria bacterium]|nr:hypothetical protein [Pseudomonadota bacterium]